MKIWRSALLLAAFSVWAACSAKAQTVTFDLDTGTPTLYLGQGTPFDQTSGAITAHFSSPSDGGPFAPAYSVQSDGTTFFYLPWFSGQYLYPDTVYKASLDIAFSQPLSGITFNFATADFGQNEIPTTLQVTAYQDSTANPPVGSATAHGAYGTGTMPQGTMTFNSGGQPFNLVEILIPYDPLAASDFLVDTIIVTPYSTLPATQTTNVSIASAQIGQKVALAATLTHTADNSPLSGAPITFSIGSTTLGTATTNAGGVATLTYKVADTFGTGDMTLLAAFAGDASNQPSTGTGVLTIDPAITRIIVPNISAKIGQKVTLKGTLKRTTDNAGLPGYWIAFSINGSIIGAAPTTSTGLATLSYVIPEYLGLGAQTQTVSFVGNNLYSASSGTSTLTVSKGAVKLTVSSVAGKAGSTVTLKATLRNVSHAPLVGKTLDFSVNGVAVGSAATSATGLATMSYTIPSGTASGTVLPLLVRFGGDALYLASSGIGKLTVK